VPFSRTSTIIWLRTLDRCDVLGDEIMSTRRNFIGIIARYVKHENHTRSGRLLAQVVLLTGICLAAACCFAADGRLPNISVNDNRAPAGRLDSGVLTLHLELREGLWHPEADDGRAIDVYSFAEGGQAPQTPGPLIQVPQGSELHVSVHNLLSVAVYVHGLHEHPGKTDDSMQLAPGEIKEARFAAGEPGSYPYWAATSGRNLETRPLEAGRGADHQRR
jgi:FtsP/CotA-like multicopper oxidase with cupredoxin domain